MKFRKTISSMLAMMMVMSGMPLYVNAVDDTYGKFVFEEDTWRFPNASLFWSDDYYYSAPDYQTLMQNMKNTEKWGAVQCFTGSWSGSCYGMAVLSVLACYDLVDYSQYCTEQGNPISLRDMNPVGSAEYAPSGKEQSLINYYSNLQFLDCIRQHDTWNMYNTTDAKRLQMLIESVEDGSPAVLSFHRLGTATGHAVVAYGVEYGNYSNVSGTMEHYDGRVLIYNPNYHFEDSQSYLYFSTEDWSWGIPRSFGSDEGMLLPILDDVNLLNQGGLLGGTEPYVSENPFMDVYITNQLESAYTLQQMTLQEDGTWSRNDASMDYCQETSAFYIDPILTAATNFLLPGEEHGYVFDVESSQELETSMYYEDSLVYIYAKNASQTVADPSGYAAFSGIDTDYTLELVRNEGHYVTDWYDIAVSGHGDSATLRMTEDGYILTADNLENVTISGKNDSNTQTLTVSTDVQSVLIYETEYGMLTTSVDTDGDGSYEQELSEFALGDVDENGTVDASDAAAILTAAAKMGAGEDSGLTNVQKAKADVNADGEIDASDAALILQYAAEVGSGNDVGSLDEFLFLITKSV